jgi:exonuclease III
LKLISWNVNGNSAVAKQVDALLGERPDVVALQEVRERTVDAWLHELAALGFSVVTSRDLADGRRNFLLTASRYPIAEVESILGKGFPYPERLLSTRLRTRRGDFTLLNTHVPDRSAHGWRKVEHFEGLYSLLARTHPAEFPRILCGDFNSPRRELRDGRVITWAQRENGTMRPARGPRWDAAERSVLLGLAAFGLRDVYRRKHPYESEQQDASWVAKRHGKVFRRRFDHLFASTELRIRDCFYLHAWRKRVPPLSDHSAICAVLSWP